MLYAIIKSGDKQFRVEKGLTLQLPLLEANEGDSIELNDVLLCSNGEDVVVGSPTVENASVKATVLGEEKGEKIVVFKMKRRKKYRNKTGHRQSFTSVKITDLVLPVKDNAPKPAEPEKAAEPESENQESVKESAPEAE